MSGPGHAEVERVLSNTSPDSISTAPAMAIEGAEKKKQPEACFDFVFISIQSYNTKVVAPAILF